MDIRFGIATGVDFSSSPRKVTIDGRKIVETDAVIIATGAQAKYLGLESETLFKGQGVSACATCDGFFYRNQDVIVVGGGDSACEEATYLASICNKVYMVVRKDHLRASKAMQRRVMETPNIEIKFGYNTVQVLGDQNGVTGALVRHSGGEELVIDATGFFLAIGHTPNTAVFKGALELDAEGYIRTEPGTSRTSVREYSPPATCRTRTTGRRLRRRVGLYGRARLRALSAGAVIGGVVIDLQALFRIGDDSASNVRRSTCSVFRPSAANRTGSISG